MTDDPIVAEVRAIRDKLAAECGYDVEEIVRRIRQRQAESGREYVSYPPRRVASREDAAGPGGRRSAGMTMELETITRVPVERLRLDRESPRLAGEAAEASDEWIVARLYRSAVLEELLLSFSANGYLDMEPLVVMAGHDADEGGLIVLEGNRRLATLRLLREPGLVRRIASAENLRISVPAVDDSVRTTFDRVSVYRVASRERARAFMAFKHMKGPAKWDAYRKARFAADWYRAGGADGGALEQIAAAIGDRHDTVRRMVSAIYVLEQAEREGLFDIEDRGTPKFAFSHLYAALSRSQYAEYLGLGWGWVRHGPMPNPVPREKFDELRKLLVWLYGSKSDDARPVVEMLNPDIRRLGDVLANVEARNVLEQTRDLAEAYASTESVDRRFASSLLRARETIGDAGGSLRAYDGKDKSLLHLAEDVKEAADSVYLSMAKKRRSALSGN